MSDLRFVKYSLYGNHFVMVDEIGQVPLDEKEKSSFARRAADPHAGIGADSVLFLQPLTNGLLHSIPCAGGSYCTGGLSGRNVPGLIARFFEPNGDEFLTCADGLMCIAHHLFRDYGIEFADVLVEVPSNQPRVCSVVYSSETRKSTVYLRPDMSRIDDFVSSSFAAHRDADLRFFSQYSVVTGGRPIVVSGILLYTGEPHMVVFQHGSAQRPEEWPTAIPWAMSCPDVFSENDDDDKTTGINAVGVHANQHMKESFPHGINVNFARPLGDGMTIEYRCFERGLCRETLACGTGALAVSLAALRLGFVRDQKVRMLPRLGRRHTRYGHADITVDQTTVGIGMLTSEAEYVFSGVISRSGGAA